MSTTRDRIAREARICDAALAIVADGGLRALTHRAVDERAELPAGSTSYYFRTRQALLDALIDRLAERHTGEPPALPDQTDQTDLETMAAAIGDRLAALLDDPVSVLARYELSLEATRRPELRRTLEDGGASLRTSAAEIVAALGSTDPERHGRWFVSWCDGLVYDALVGAGARHRPGRAELVAAVRAMLRGLVA